MPSAIFSLKTPASEAQDSAVTTLQTCRPEASPATLPPASERASGGSETLPLRQSRPFRLGIYIFEEAEIIDFAAPYAVFSIARRRDPRLEALFLAETRQPVRTQSLFPVLPNHTLEDHPTLDALLIPGGFGVRREMHNPRLHAFIRSLPGECLLASVWNGTWIYQQMGLLGGLGNSPGTPGFTVSAAHRLKQAEVVDTGRVMTVSGVASGVEMGLHLLRRAGYDDSFIDEVARSIEYSASYDIYRRDLDEYPAQESVA